LTIIAFVEPLAPPGFLLGWCKVKFGELHKPLAQAKEGGWPSLAQEACVPCQPFPKRPEQPFGSRPGMTSKILERAAGFIPAAGPLVRDKPGGSRSAI
jgi:hypothetical protein